MKSLKLSIRVIVTLTIILMGLQGLVLALLSSEIYRDHAIKNHKSTIEKLIKIRSDQILIGLANKARQLGLSQQQQPEFKTALKNRNAAKLEQILNSHFHRYFVTAGILKLEKLIVFDKDFSFIAETTEGDSAIPPHDMVCDDIIFNARYAAGPDRLKIKSGVCEYRNKTYHMIITPIGGLVPKGYMAVITDPVNNLLAMEQDLGMAMKFAYNNGFTVYKSTNWDNIKNNEEFLLTDYKLTTSYGDTSLHIETIENIRPLYNKMPDIHVLVMVSASLITAVAIIIALIIIHKTTLSPLHKITNLLSLIRTDRERLSDKLEVKGTSEIRLLASSFNDMTSQLEELYGRMEEMAFTDHLTSLPNRHLFTNKLHNTISVLKYTGKSFALLMMDLNKFKPINDNLGHKVGDKVLQEVGSRLKNILRANDSLLRIDKNEFTENQADTIARLGGDEFSAIITDINDTDTARVVAEKIVYAMRKPFIVDNHRLEVGISIGIALYPRDARDDHDLLHKADLAMYHAKKSQHSYAFYKDDEHAVM